MRRNGTAIEAFLGVFAIGIIRNLLEHLLAGHMLVSTISVKFSFETLFLHYNTFWFLIYLSLCLVLHGFCSNSTSISESFRVGLMAMPIILCPPVIDCIINYQGEIAYPSNPMTVFRNFHRLFDPTYTFQGITAGMRCELGIVGIASSMFLFKKERRVVKSILCGITVVLTCLLVGTIIPTISQLYENGIHFSQDFKLGNSILLHQGFIVSTAAEKTTLLYISLCLIFASVAYYIRSKSFFNAVISNFRWSRSLHYMLLFFGGMIYIYNCPPYETGIYDYSFDFLKTIPNNPFNIFGILMSAVALFLAFQSAVIFNDINDIDIDRRCNRSRPLVMGTIPVAEFRQIAILFLTTSLIISLCINESFFLLMLSYILMSFLYSSRPFRMRKYFLVSNLLLATIFVVTFHAGACVLIRHYWIMTIPPRLSICLLCGYFVALTIKDLKDYDGDKEDGVQTIVTILGEKNGTIATIALICTVIILLPVALKISCFVIPATLFCLVLIATCLSKLSIEKKEIIITMLYFAYMILLFTLMI